MKLLISIFKNILPFNHDGARGKALINTYWLILDQVIRMCLGFFILGIITRNIGAYSFGQLNYAIAFVSLFSVLTTLGIDRIIVKEIVEDQKNYILTLGTSFYLKFFGSFLLIAVSVLTSIFVFGNNQTTTGLILIFSFSYIFQTSDVIEFLYQSNLEAKYIVIIKLITFLISSILKVVIVLNTKSILGLASIYLLESILSALFLFILFKFHHGNFLLSFNTTKAKKLLSEGLPLLFATLFVTIYMKIDQVFLQYYSDSTAVGLYSAAVRVSEIPFFVGTIITTAAFPLVIKAKKLGRIKYVYRFRLLLSVLTYSAFLISITFYIFSDLLISVIFGSSFAAASAILRIHVWSLLFVFIGLAQGIWLIGEGETKLSFAFTVVGALINVILNIILIPIYDGKGAAFATLISYMFAAFLANFFLKKTRVLGIMQIKSLSPQLLLNVIRKRGI
jgi:PST family polysaccharide transporter